MRTNLRHFLPTLAALTLACGAVGCQRHAMVEVAGRVTVDGEPLPEGTISFVPREQDGPSAGTIVQHGNYKLLTLPGKKLVRIEGFKTIGERRAEPADITSRTVPIKQQIIAETYNRKSNLTCDIQTPNQSLDFEITK